MLPTVLMPSGTGSEAPVALAVESVAFAAIDAGAVSFMEASRAPLRASFRVMTVFMASPALLESVA